MKVVVLTALVILASFGAKPARAEAILKTEADVRRLTFDQKLGAKVPLDLEFQDEENRPVALRDCVAARPSILILGYYACPMLCNLVLNGVVETLQEIKPAADEGQHLIFVSIDPREKPGLAAAKKATYLKRLGRPGTAERWHFLSGSEPEIRRLAEQVGFHFQYDPDHAQYAHPSGIIILTPDGTISRYLFGVSYPAQELKEALHDASLRKTSSPVQALVILCSRFLPLTGKFSATVMTAVRVIAVSTVLLIVGFVAWSCRRAPGQAAAERNHG